MATMVPSMVCPSLRCFALIEASNIAAKSSLDSPTSRSLRSLDAGVTARFHELDHGWRPCTSLTALAVPKPIGSKLQQTD